MRAYACTWGEDKLRDDMNNEFSRFDTSCGSLFTLHNCKREKPFDDFKYCIFCGGRIQLVTTIH